MMDEKQALMLTGLHGFFSTLGEALGKDPRCPFCLIVNLDKFVPENGVILPTQMQGMSHVFTFAIKLKSQIEKEIKEQEKKQKEKSDLIV